MKEKKNKDCANHVEEGDRYPTMLVMSGGEGYVDFRIGDGDEEEEDPGTVLLLSRPSVLSVCPVRPVCHVRPSALPVCPVLSVVSVCLPCQFVRR